MLTQLYIRGQMLLDDLRNDQRGVTAIEYAVIAAAVAVVVIAVFDTVFQAKLLDKLNDVRAVIGAKDAKIK